MNEYRWTCEECGATGIVRDLLSDPYHWHTTNPFEVAPPLLIEEVAHAAD